MLKKCLLLVSLLLLPALPLQAAVILIYHHVAENTPRSTSVTPAEFRAHLQYFKDHNFDVIGLDKLLSMLQQNQPLPENAIAITFDDSYENNYSAARPLLKEFGFPYTVFISPEVVDQQPGPFMNWEQLREMAAEGALIANHSSLHDHMARPAAGESKADWLNRMEQDILRAEQRIKDETGQSHRWLAYPYGEFSDELEQLVKRLGFIGIGQQSGAVGPYTSLTRVPRYPAAGQYADLKDLSQKLKTLAFPIIDYLAASQVITSNPPVLRLKLNIEDFLPRQLRCYAGSEILEPVWLDDNTFEVLATKPVSKGRSRYNCTAPSLSKKGYYYWYSQPWLN